MGFNAIMEEITTSELPVRCARARAWDAGVLDAHVVFVCADHRALFRDTGGRENCSSGHQLRDEQGGG